MNRLWAVLLAVPALVAQSGSEPKAKAADYPAHAIAGPLGLGAEYMVHSFSLKGQMFVTEDYLTVEVALYPPDDTAFLVSAAHFRLRVNNKKQTLYSQTPGMVAASLKYPDWHERRGLEGSAGAGNAGVILGTPSSRFPGDSRDRRRLPAPPRAPEEENRSGIERAPETKAEDAVVGAALPEGPQRGPVAGCLYFPYDGKLKSLKTLELLYEGPRGTASLRLM